MLGLVVVVLWFGVVVVWVEVVLWSVELVVPVPELVVCAATPSARNRRGVMNHVLRM